jgi:hypothetical protein
MRAEPGKFAEKARKQRQTEAYKVWRAAYEKADKYRERIRRYSSARRRDEAVKPKLKAYYDKHREKFRLRYLIRHAALRCKKNGTECDIAYLERLIGVRPEICPCCSCKLDYAVNSGKHMPKVDGPSLDRIDCTRGYVEGNVAVICWRCNALKRDASLVELERIVAYMKARL